MRQTVIWALGVWLSGTLIAGPGLAAGDDDFESLLNDDKGFDAGSELEGPTVGSKAPPSGTIDPAGLGELGGEGGFDPTEPAVATAGSTAALETWGLLHSLSARVRERGARPLPALRVRALELGMGAAVEGQPVPLGPLLRQRWNVLLSAARSGLLANGAELEAALDGPLDSPALARLVGSEALAASVRAAERVARLSEDRFAARLDGLIFGPLPIPELLAMLRASDRAEQALEELRERGPGGLFPALLPRLAEAGDASARVLEIAGRYGDEAEKALLERMAGIPGARDFAMAEVAGDDLAGGLDDELARPLPAVTAGLAALAAVAAGRIEGRMKASEWLLADRSRSMAIFEEAAAAHERSGDWRRAADCWGMAARQEPSNAVAAYGRAKALYRLGLFEQAHEWAQRAMTAGPVDRRYVAMAAGSLRALGRWTEVLPLLQREARTAEGGALKSYLQLQIAGEQLANGEGTAATQSIALASAGFVPPEQEPRRAALLAEVAWSGGQKEKSTRILLRANAENPGSRLLERRLAWIGAAAR